VENDYRIQSSAVTRKILWFPIRRGVEKGK